MINNLWTCSLAAWHDWLKAGGIRSQTLSLRVYQMRRFAQDHAAFDPWSLDQDDLGAWLARHDWGLESLRSYRSALRSFYGWAHASGKRPTDPSRLLRPVKTPEPHPRPAADNLIEGAMRRADERTRLLLLLGAREGLRRGEMACIHSDDLARDDHGWSLTVHGKGGKQRVVPLTGDIAAELIRRGHGWVFPNGRGRHITAAHVGVLIRRVLDGATTHQLRHRFASAAYQATHDIRAVQEILGHASVATTQRYTATAPDALRKVVNAAV